MIKIAVSYNDLGKILRVRSGSAGGVDLDVAEWTDPYIFVDEQPNVKTQYVSAGAIVDMPPRPSEQHEFDYVTKAWRLNTAELNRQASELLRVRRDGELAGCDWTQVPDAPVDAEAWRVYRQQLRDLPAQYPDILSIDEVVWPNPPE